MPLNIEFWWNKKKWLRILEKENIKLKGWNSTNEWRLIKGNARAISFFSGHETAIITTATAHSLTDGPFTLSCIVSLNMSDDMWRWWMNSVSFCQTCLCRFKSTAARRSRHDMLSIDNTVHHTRVYSTQISIIRW